MHSKRPALGSRTLRIAQVALFLVGLAPPALAETFSVTLPDNTDSDGTVRWAIDQANESASSTNTILFTENLLSTLNIATDNALDSIALAQSADVVELNATTALGFEIVREGDAVPEFNILEVARGKATIVDLKISGGDFEIKDGAKLEFKDTEVYADREITNIIKGAGQLIKSGDQKLILSGANTYMGGTTLTGGTLQGDREGLKAVNQAFVFDAVPGEAAPTLVFSDAKTDDWSWAGETEGEGKVIKEGANILKLTGTGFTHQGGTEIAAGTLQASATKLLNSDIRVDGTGTLSFEEVGGDSSFDHVISGTGQVRKLGAGTLVLSEANSFEGGLTIEAGTVKGSAAAMGSGDITLESGHEVHFTEGGDFLGGVKGTGHLTKSGSDQLIIYGNMEAGVDTSLLDTSPLPTGSLELRGTNLASNITADDGTKVIFQPTQSSATFSGTISGIISTNSVDVEKRGSNKLTFSQAQSYTGETLISGGTLVLADSLGSSSQTEVKAGAALATASGSGTVTLGGGLQNWGTIALPDSDSILSASGFIELEAGSQLELAVGQTDNGKLTSSLGNVEIKALALKLTNIQRTGCEDTACTITVVEATSGTLTADDLQKVTTNETNLAYWKVDTPLISGSNALTITIRALNDSSIYAQTANQLATAPAWNYVRNSDTPDGIGLKVASDSYSPEQVRQTLDQVAGESLASFINAREANAQQFAHALWERFRASQYEPGWYDFQSGGAEEEEEEEEERASKSLAPVSAPAVNAGTSKKSRNRFAGWAQPFGIFTENDGRGRASDMKSRVYGLTGGVDYALPGSLGLRVGGALGYTRYSIFSESGSQMEGQANTYQGALYAAWQNRHFHVGIAGRYGYTTMQSQRIISVGDPRRAAARFAGQEGGGMIEIGATFGDPTFFAVRPLAAFQYDRLTQNSFKENGAGDLSLRVSQQDYTSMLTTIGARISKLYPFEGGFGIEPEIRVGWTYQSGDKARPITATTYNLPGSPTFTTYGAEPDRNAIWVGAGYVMRTTDTVRVGLDYDAYIGEYYTQQVVSAELQIIW